MNVFTRTFSKIFKSSNQAELDKTKNLISAINSKENSFSNADSFLIDRPDARKHLSFGFGIHRCMGNRLAEMQLRVLWEEILKRFKKIEMTGPVKMVNSSFVKGYSHLPAIIEK